VKWRRKYLAALEDLERLRILRGWATEIPEGFRHAYLTTYGICARQAFGASSGQATTYNLARSLTGWTEAEIESHLASVFTRPDRYSLRNETIDSRLAITADERRALRTFRREKQNAAKRERYREERDAAGLRTQEQRAAEVVGRRERANTLNAAGYTNADIAFLLSVSTKSVRRYLGSGQPTVSLTLIEANECPPLRERGAEGTETHPEGLPRSVPEHAPWLPAPPPCTKQKTFTSEGQGVGGYAYLCCHYMETVNPTKVVAGTITPERLSPAHCA